MGVCTTLSLASSNLREILYETSISRQMQPIKAGLAQAVCRDLLIQQTLLLGGVKLKLRRKKQLVVFLRDLATADSTAYFANDTT